MTNYARKLQSEDVVENYPKLGITFVGLFGSAARNEDGLNSDIDLLIDYDEDMTLFGLGKAKRYFQKVLGKKVDLSSKTHIKPSFKQSIFNDLTVLYEQG